MNEDIDLTKILKDCPKGTKFYSTIDGEVEFVEIGCSNPDLVYFTDDHYEAFCYFKNGRHFKNRGECILFPSKEQRDTLFKAKADAGFTFDFDEKNPLQKGIVDWLNSLKDRVGCKANCTTMWKPSDEQMEVLKEATNIAGDKYKSCLNSLYSDLKKLKG